MIVAVNVELDPQWAPCGNCGCQQGVAAIPTWEIPGVLERTNQCPRRATSSDSKRWIALYSHYRQGHLLISGGIADQPSAYLQAMKLITDWVNQEHGKSPSKV